MTTTPLRLAGVFALAFISLPARAATPQVGEIAPNFTRPTLDDHEIELNRLREKSPVVLVMLRGWPGYQCPVCTKQVRDFVSHAGDFERRGLQVLMVYPGPAAQLQAHAREFLEDKNWPASFRLVIDPDYAVTTLYGLRWDAKNETAYPATFVIARDGRITFDHVSKSHGDRVGAEAALAAAK